MLPTLFGSPFSDGIWLARCDMKSRASGFLRRDSLAINRNLGGVHTSNRWRLRYVSRFHMMDKLRFGLSVVLSLQWLQNPPRLVLSQIHLRTGVVEEDLLLGVGSQDKQPFPDAIRRHGRPEWSGVGRGLGEVNYFGLAPAALFPRWVVCSRTAGRRPFSRGHSQAGSRYRSLQNSEVRGGHTDQDAIRRVLPPCRTSLPIEKCSAGGRPAIPPFHFGRAQDDLTA
jgi:hypothetical protein